MQTQVLCSNCGTTFPVAVNDDPFWTDVGWLYECPKCSAKWPVRTIQDLQAEHCDPANPLDVIPLPTEVRASVQRWLAVCEPLMERTSNSEDGRAFKLSFAELSELLEADDELKGEVPAPKWTLHRDSSCDARAKL